MPRTFIPIHEHFDALDSTLERERQVRSAYSYRGVVKEEVWGLAYRVGEVVRDGATGQTGTIVAATNRQVVEVSGA